MFLYIKKDILKKMEKFNKLNFTPLQNKKYFFRWKEKN